MTNEKVALPALVLVCLVIAYIWIALSCGCRVYGYGGATGQPHTDQPKEIRMMQFYLFLHSAARALSMVLSFAVTSDPSLRPLRETVLSDIPGLAYFSIYCNLMFYLAKLVMETKRVRLVGLLGTVLSALGAAVVLVWVVTTILLSSTVDVASSHALQTTEVARYYDFGIAYLAVSLLAASLTSSHGLAALPPSVVIRSLG